MKEILYSKIDEKQLTTFHFAKNALPTEGKEKGEFMYGNIWYDIVKTVVQQDSIIVFAIADHAETHLVKHLAQSIETNLYQQGETAKKVALTLRSIFSESVPADASFFLHKIDFQHLIKHNFFYLNIFPFPIVLKDTPPPQYFSFC